MGQFVNETAFSLGYWKSVPYYTAPLALWPVKLFAFPQGAEHLKLNS